MPRLVASIRRKCWPAVGDAPPCLALRGLEVTVGEAEFVALVGPSGCGKTTFLNIVAGLDKAFDGECSLAPRPDGSSARVGYVFQTARLLPWRTVYDNLALVLDPRQDRAVVDRLLAAVDLVEAARVYPPRLSGGMAQRVALARAFAIGPEILLMDEPFSALDRALAERLRRLVLEMLAARPTTVVMVTHDLHEAVALADRILVLSPAPGRVIVDFPIRTPRDRRDGQQTLKALQDELAIRSASRR